MPTVESTVLIKGNLDDVYRLAKDIEKFPEFMPDVESVRIVDREGENTTISEWVGVVKQFRLKIKWTERDVWDDAAHTCEFSQVKGDHKEYRGTWTFRDRDSQVEFHSVLHYDVNIPLIGPMIRKVIEIKMKENLDKILQAIKAKAEEAG